MAREAILARTLVELADTLVADYDIVELLTMLADRCVMLLGVDAAGLMLVNGNGDLQVIASSSDAMRVLELFELEAHEGPCLECFATRLPVVNLDLNVDLRWPRFSAEAIAAGYHSVHALPMRLRGDVVGALNLFHEGVGRMEPEDVAAAQAMADIATIALLQHRATSSAKILAENLSHALNSRVAIEQAKGVIAERIGLDMPDAFHLLRQHARQHNRRLADVADAVIDGTLTAADLQATAKTLR